MHLAHSTMEDSPIQWYALVNRSQDPAAKIASGYSPAELELFNKVVGAWSVLYLIPKPRPGNEAT